MMDQHGEVGSKHLYIQKVFQSYFDVRFIGVNLAKIYVGADLRHDSGVHLEKSFINIPTTSFSDMLVLYHMILSFYKIGVSQGWLLSRALFCDMFNSFRLVVGAGFRSSFIHSIGKTIVYCIWINELPPNNTDAVKHE